MSGSFWFGFWMGLSAGIVTTALLRRRRTQPCLEDALLGPPQPSSNAYTKGKRDRKALVDAPSMRKTP